MRAGIMCPIHAFHGGLIPRASIQYRQVNRNSRSKPLPSLTVSTAIGTRVSAWAKALTTTQRLFPTKWAKCGANN
jgi:hypothetical protein